MVAAALVTAGPRWWWTGAGVGAGAGDGDENGDVVAAVPDGRCTERDDPVISMQLTLLS